MKHLKACIGASLLFASICTPIAMIGCGGDDTVTPSTGHDAAVDQSVADQTVPDSSMDMPDTNEPDTTMMMMPETGPVDGGHDSGHDAADAADANQPDTAAYPICPIYPLDNASPSNYGDLTNNIAIAANSDCLIGNAFAGGDQAIDNFTCLLGQLVHIAGCVDPSSSTVFPYDNTIQDEFSVSCVPDEPDGAAGVGDTVQLGFFDPNVAPQITNADFDRFLAIARRQTAAWMATQTAGAAKGDAGVQKDADDFLRYFEALRSKVVFGGDAGDGGNGYSQAPKCGDAAAP